MARRRQSKKPRGSRGARQAPCIDDNVSHPYHDMFVLLPKASSAATESQTQSQLLLFQLMDRLAFTGYSTAAMTHTVYGRPKLESDAADKVFRTFSFGQEEKCADEAAERPAKRPRTEPIGTTKKSQPKINILKRLHGVVENLSDVASYTLQPTGYDKMTENTTRSPLDDYDIVSISPRNDVTFQAACASATAASIVTLDYTSGRGGVQLPFRIRSADIKAIVQRNATIELPYATALLHPSKRKALVQTARELQMACLSVHPKPRIILSSGDRTVEEVDTGAMALRSPGDLINVLQTVLRFSQTVSYDALSASGTALLNRIKQAKLGLSDSDVVVEVLLEGESTSAAASQGKAAQSEPASELIHETESADRGDNSGDKDDAGDGFITLS